MNLLICADWLLAFFARVTLKLNSLVKRGPKRVHPVHLVGVRRVHRSVAQCKLGDEAAFEKPAAVIVRVAEVEAIAAR